MIRIVCREPSHADRPYPVVGFRRNAAGAWGDYTRRTSAVLDGDVPGDPGDGGRLRHRLDCRRCGLCVEVRAERLNPVLDRLEAHGQAEVTLRALAAII